MDRRGAMAYDCRFQGDGRLVHRHADQLRRVRFEEEGHEDRERQGSSGGPLLPILNHAQNTATLG